MHLSLIAYLRREQYSDAFIDDLFIPTVCAICTCTTEAARNYPAEVIVKYLVQRFMFGVRRAVGGTAEVCSLLVCIVM